jgi:phospholipid transport system substrate-binding protein
MTGLATARHVIKRRRPGGIAVDSRLTLMHMLCRRAVILCLVVAIGWSGARPARALDIDAARAHVDATIEQILELIRASKPRAETARTLRAIFEQKAALPQLARFTAGRHWRAMSSDQQARFTETFSNYLAHVYAGHFREFDGEIADLRAAVSITGAEDAGAKGVLVRSEIRPAREVRISIEWLVSDRSGRIAISDLIVEGVSLAVTQREIIGAMLEARGGDVGKLIADLEKQQVATGP